MQTDNTEVAESIEVQTENFVILDNWERVVERVSQPKVTSWVALYRKTRRIRFLRRVHANLGEHLREYREVKPFRYA